MFKTSWRYWLCQLGGWGGWALINVFFALQFASDIYLQPEAKRNLFSFAIFLDLFWSIAITHALRTVLKRINWMRFSFASIVAMFVIGTISAGLLEYSAYQASSKMTGLSLDEYTNNERKEKAILMEKEMGLNDAAYYNYQTAGTIDSAKYNAFMKIKSATGWHRNDKGEWNFEEPRKGKDFWGITITFILMALWLLIYLIWHYINKIRNDQIDKLQLEAMVKSLELKTIKSHTNPHFIFNAHNSIRALVDENPARARQAITELSNILRSSMQAEKLEAVPLEQELDIVRDHLALEQMRFEDRLRVEFDIHPDTLTQSVPPMMLQMLVENAIKHGIGKRVHGGVVRVTSSIMDGHHQLCVQNSGDLADSKGKVGEGFGIQSTKDRLNLLYQGKARFDIRQMEEGIVEARILLPVTK